MATLQEAYKEKLKNYSDVMLKSQIESHEKMDKKNALVVMAINALKEEAAKRKK